jgi:hypothetical protein
MRGKAAAAGRATAGWRAVTVHAESGQASIFLLLILGVFLLASVAFAVDLANLWFRRSTAQTAADAACVAGALDMLYLQNGTISTAPGFPAGKAGQCSASSSAAICKYAGFNGFTATVSSASWGASTAAGAVAVSWTFPSSATGVTGTPGVSYPFLKVAVQQKVATWFMGLMGVRSQTVGAACTCGMTGTPSTPALLVLNPTIGSALNISGGASIAITGGGSTSIQVNSSANASPSSNSSGNAVYCGGSSPYPIDTSAGGPDGNGGDLAVAGGPTANPTCGSSLLLNGGTKGSWNSGATAVADPYSGVPAPTQPAGQVAEAATPAATPAQGYTPTFDSTYGYIYGTWVKTGTDSCPNTNATQHYLSNANGVNYYGNCLEFTPGYYPNGIDTSSAQNGGDVVIFMPGIYFLNGNLSVGGSTTVRNAWIGTQPSTSGVLFYFLSGGPAFAGNTGAASFSSVSSVPSYYSNCSGTSTPSGAPASLTGNLLVAQCSAGGTYVGTGSSDSYSSSGQRGLIFFAAHSNSFQTTLVGGSATLNFGGTAYFHNSSYADQITWNGAGSSTNYAIGSLVVDQLTLSGSGALNINASGSSTNSTAVGIFQ